MLRSQRDHHNRVLRSLRLVNCGRVGEHQLVELTKAVGDLAPIELDQHLAAFGVHGADEAEIAAIDLLMVSDKEQAQLQSIARSRSLPPALVRRANMVLACAAGATNSAVARRFGTTNATVGKWRQRFVARRIEGLHDELRPGKPRSIDDERIAALLNTTLHARPKDGTTHWGVRGLAAETGIAKTSVHRFLQAFGLQPHRRDSFKLSTDPFFIEKLRDVVGLYLNPPDKALVLCLD